MKIELRRTFELKNNEDMTQNLYSKCYSNNILVSEHDLGDIEDIVYCKTKERNLTKYLEDKIKDCDYFVGATIHNFEDLKLSTLSSKKMKELLKTNKLVKEIYEEILERVKSGKYE